MVEILATCQKFLQFFKKLKCSIFYLINGNAFRIFQKIVFFRIFTAYCQIRKTARQEQFFSQYIEHSLHFGDNINFKKNVHFSPFLFLRQNFVRPRAKNNIFTSKPNILHTPIFLDIWNVARKSHIYGRGKVRTFPRP